MSDERLTRIEEKIDRLGDRLSSVDMTLIKQHEQLAYHIKRTDILEAKVSPISDHVAFVRVAMKILAAAALIAGIYRVFA